MSIDFDSLTSHAMALPADQRLELAERLWGSVEIQMAEDEELFAEIERRCAEVDSGVVQSIPFDEAMRETRSRLHETRDSSAGAT